MNEGHRITERLTPIDRLALCSCGWTARQTRHQNALAGSAKLRAAVRRHLNDATTTTGRQAPATIGNNRETEGKTT